LLNSDASEGVALVRWDRDYQRFTVNNVGFVNQRKELLPISKRSYYVISTSLARFFSKIIDIVEDVE
jgi:hypothetical protein